MAEEVVDASRIWGISKRIDTELQALPLVAHSTIFANLSNMVQHRQISEKMAADKIALAEQEKQREQQAALNERHVAAIEAKNAREHAEQLKRESGIVLAHS